MNKELFKKNYFVTYAPDSDITFIMCDYVGEDGKIYYTGVSGFYYGPPDKEQNKLYKDDLIAEFKGGL